MTAGRSRLPVLRDKLVRSRRRMAAVRLIRLAVRSVLIGLVMLLTLELLRLLIAPGWLVTGPRALTELLPSLLLVVVVFSIGLLLALHRLPSLDMVAMTAERHYRLAETLSSALEVAEKEPANLPEWCLLRDAESQAERIEPSRLIPVGPPRSLRLLPVPLVLLGALQFLPITAGLTDEAGGVARAEVTHEEITADISTEAVSLARLIEEVAAQEDDQYLAAIARSYRELAERVEAGEVRSDELSRELSQLADHLERALGEEVAGGTDVFDRLPSTLATAKAELEAREAADAAARAREAAAAARGESEDPASDSADSEFEDMFRQHAFDFTPGVDEPAEAGPRAPGEVIGNTGNYANPDPEVIAETERRRQEAAMRAEGRGEVPIGAAQDSNEGAGDLAGEGTQPLERGLTGDGDTAAAEREAVALPEGDPRAGRRVEVELPPETVYTLVDAQSLPSGEWNRSRESAGNSSPVGIINRDVVARYFLPLNRGVE